MQPYPVPHAVATAELPALRDHRAREPGDLKAMVEALKCLFPTLTEFERDFPSLCFALATGVGKTRLALSAAAFDAPPDGVWLLRLDALGADAQLPGPVARLLGLGAGAITKFCHKKLRLCATAIELNPQVLAVCRQWFKLPPDGAKLRVILGDAAKEIRDPMWLGTVDALAVDLYDHEAAAPVLDSPDFYADCRALLSEDGCMTVNLFGRSSSFERSLQSMATAFGEEALWAFKPTREGNTVVLAQRTPSRPKRAELMARAEVVQERWGLPATKWLRVFKPVVA